MQATRIVQITDLHVLAEDDDEICGVKPNRSLAMVIDDINRLSSPAELVIASGDLTDAGSPAAYRQLGEILARLKCPVYVMAGNHDETDIMLSELCKGQVLYRDSIECGRWRILLIDSKTEAASYGTISADELNRIETELNAHDYPLLLAMHHTPLRLCASSSCQMQNADAILACIKQHTRIKGLIAGHTHNEVDEVLNMTRIMTTPSTMVQVTHNQSEACQGNEEFWHYHTPDTSRHGYRVVDLFADGSLQSEVRWVDSGLL